jgi:hypothetical protein
LESYLAYGEPVVAPCVGRVVTVIDGIEDQAPGAIRYAPPYGNHVRACLRWMIADLVQDFGSVSQNMIRTWAPDDFWLVAQPLILSHRRDRKAAASAALTTGSVKFSALAQKRWRAPGPMWSVTVRDADAGVPVT